MKRNIVGAFVIAFFGSVLCWAQTTGDSRTIAYVVPSGTIGNQDLSIRPQSLGMDFDVNSAISITSLGVFDSGGDGLVGPLRVHIYNRDTQTALASLDFTTDQPGRLVAGSRFRPLNTPLTLSSGFRGSIVVDYMTSPTEPNGNKGAGPGNWTTDSGGGLISFVGSARTTYSGIGYPSIVDAGPANRYAAGTFMFAPASASTIAYVVPSGTIGNQDLSSVPQSLGMDFDVNSAISITSLGVFDSGGDGLVGPLRAHIYNRETQTALASLDFTPTNSGTLIGGSRFRSLTNPLVLPQGFRGTVVVDYLTSPTEPNGNMGNGNGNWTTDSGGGLISFVGPARTTVSGIGYPNVADTGPANRYAAGTFMFSAATASPHSSFDLSLDFATSSNPNGAWSYGSQDTIGGAFKLLSTAQTANADNGVPVILWAYAPSTQPAIFHNDTTNTAVTAGEGVYPPETTWFAPGVQGQPGNFAVARLTIPAGGDGTYRLVTTARPAFGDSVQLDTGFHVVRNNVEIFGVELARGQRAGYTNTMTLAAGDTIDFLVGRGTDNSYIWSVLKVEASLDLVSTDPAPPVIIAQPASQTVVAGTTVSFTVSASGSAPLNYQWFKNGAAIDGATGSTLTLNNVRLSQSGEYSVVVSNAYGVATSQTALLTVNVAPPRADFDLSLDFAISNNPNGAWSYGRQETVGGPFTLFGLTQVNHSENGVPVIIRLMSANTQPAIFHNDTTQTATTDGGRAIYPPETTWFAPGVQGQPGNYAVARFTVPLGREGTYQLITTARPAYVDSLQLDTDFHVTKNNVKIFGAALNGGQRAGYTNQISLAAGDTIDFAVGRGGDNSYFWSVLKIEATLDLVSTNPVPPTIITQPASQTVMEGATASFTVSASGSAPLSYQWFKGTTSIDGAIGSTLTLNNVQLSQTGEYSVVVSNAYGVATSQTATLAVNAAPPQADYDLSRDFAISSNPNGVWSYGRKDTVGGTFTLLGSSKTAFADNGVAVIMWALNLSSQPAIQHNDTAQTAITDAGQGRFSPETTWFAPGVQGQPGNYAVARFTVPAGRGGTYQLVTMARPIYEGSLQRDSDFHVSLNNLEIFGTQLNGTQTARYTNSDVSLAPGDTIDFAVGRGVDNSHIWSGLKIQASLDHVSSDLGPPAITAQPESQTVTEGTTVSLTVSASGSAPLNYQWFKNDVAIDGAIGSTLTLNNVQLSQSGAYSVVVSNSYGVATSQTATLMVNNLPPQADYDLSRDFALSNNPNDAWSYGWQSSLGSEFTLLGHAKTNYDSAGVPVEVWAISSWETPAVLRNATSSTVVTDGGQGNYPPGTVWFYAGPFNPQNFCVARFTVPSGGDGTYALATTVRPAYNGPMQGDTDFHVVKNGVELFGRHLASTASTGYSNTIALAAGDTLDFAIGRGADNSYHGSGLKITATLDLTSTNPAPPTIVSQPASRTVDAGQMVTLGVGVRGSLPLSYQWQFNGVDLPPGTNSTLVIDYADAADAGPYRVIVNNAYGSATSSVATVTVRSSGVAPTIGSQPTGTQALAGSTVTLNVQAVGTAPLNYQWFYNGVALEGGTSRTLILSNAQPSQSGSYWVIVTNGFGSAISRSATVDVLESTQGGTVLFGNSTSNLIYDVDGITPLPAGTSYLAQLYAGPGTASVSPVGAAVGFSAPGRFATGTRRISNVPAGQIATVQVKVWETAYGATYEQALAAGGKTGASDVFTNPTGGAGSPPSLPEHLTGLQSFALLPGAGAVPPEITSQPVSQTIQLGQDASFSVSASGPSPLRYQWRLNETPLPGETGMALSITNAQNVHAGAYTVVIRNNGGAVTSQVAALTVETSRVLMTRDLGAVSEGDLVVAPIDLVNEGDVAGLSFVLRYNPDYLSVPTIAWSSALDGALKEVNESALGELRFVFAFGSGTLAAGTQSLATVNLRARSLIADAQSQLALQILDISDASGEPILYGSDAQSGRVEIEDSTSMEGDNNANGRLDVGDATLVLRLLALLDTTRPWDVAQNDFNENGVLDSGDAVKILRAVVAPTVPTAQSIAGQAMTPSALVSLDPGIASANPGSLVTYQVRLQGVEGSIAGASFTLAYPDSVLRLRGPQDYRAGPLVPQNAAPVWNVEVNGRARFAASSSTSWPANNGVLAEITFEVQNPPAEEFAWPVSLSAVEVTSDGYELNVLGSATSTFSVQPLLGGFRSTTSGNITFSFSSAGGNYAVEASTNLINWVTLTNVVGASGLIHVADPQSASLPQRFYRARIIR